jgi:hypothetical protein
MTEKFIFLMIHSEGKTLTFNFKIYVNNLLTLELTLNNFLRRYIAEQTWPKCGPWAACGP